MMRKTGLALLALAGLVLVGACGGRNAATDGRLTTGAPVGVGVGDSTLAGGNVGTGALGRGGAAGGAAAAVDAGPLAPPPVLNLGRPAWR